MKQKSIAEIVDETVVFYTTNPRSLNGCGQCVYRGPNDSRCAFSRCCDEAKVPYLRENAIVLNQPETPDYYLKPEYQGHPARFWERLQCLHDHVEYWNSTGLTQSGKDFADRLKLMFGSKLIQDASLESRET